MKKETAKVIIPIIRKLVPTLIAQDIVGVQPMGSGLDYSVGASALVDGVPWYTLRIWNQKIWHWLNEMPTANTWCKIDGYQVDVSEEILLLLKLKWPQL